MERNSENVRVDPPSGWERLQRKQLKRVCSLLSSDNLDRASIRVALFMDICGIEVMATLGRSRFLCRLRRGDRRFFYLTSEEAAEASRSLEWIFSPPMRPWRPDIGVKGCRPHEVAFAGMSFGEWLAVDNYLQGYLLRQDDSLLRSMADALWRPAHPVKWERWMLYASMMWLLSVKQSLYRRFPDLFPGSEDSELPPASRAKAVRDSVDAQLRALTRGDVTLEERILSTDMYRALTELNAQAREYNDMKAKMKS